MWVLWHRVRGHRVVFYWSSSLFMNAPIYTMECSCGESREIAR